jgi:hypothetical protein
MHLFERTVFMPPQVDEIPLPPIHAKNVGKIDSHAKIAFFSFSAPTTRRFLSKANEVSESLESWGMVPSPTSAGVVANVPCRRDGSGGPINNVKGRGIMNAEIEHLMHIVSAFVVLLRISFFIIANAIHSTVANVPEGLLPSLTAKRNRMLATNLEGVETTGCTSCTCSEMDALTQNNFMNGTATSTCTTVLLCVLLFPHHLCKQ